jgi:hypothetical protein
MGSKYYSIEVKFPMYDISIFVYFCENIRESMDKICDKHGFAESSHKIKESMYACHLFNSDKKDSIIFLPIDTGLGTAVHESYHAVCRLFKYIDAEHEEEIFAYHLDYLVSEITKLQNKITEKKKLDKRKKVR